MNEFIAYRRLAASERGRAALALEAQAAAILKFVQSQGGVLRDDFVEIERGKGTSAIGRRPKLRDAIAAAQDRRAVLVVSSLDRLSNDAGFLSHLMASGVRFAAADIEGADGEMLATYLALAGRERRKVGGRISATLQAKKQAALAAGLPNPLGHVPSLRPHNDRRREDAGAFAARLAPLLEGFRRSGLTQRRMVEELNRLGVKTPAGGTWSLVQLQRVLARIPGTPSSPA